MKPLAFSPGSITVYFQILREVTTGKLLSRGLSINIREGVAASLKEAGETKVFFNGNPIEMPTVSMVVHALALRPVHLFLASPLPIGCGFGVSAAAALSAAFALNAHFKSGKTRQDLEEIAYTAEVQNKTGVGDVAAQLHGGIVYRHGNKKERLSLTVPDFYCSVYGPIETKAVLSSADALEKINTAGKEAIDKMSRRSSEPSFEDVLDAGWLFSSTCGLMTEEVRRGVETIKDNAGKAFMIMIGNAIVGTLPDHNAAQNWKTNVDTQGTRTL